MVKNMCNDQSIRENLILIVFQIFNEVLIEFFLVVYVDRTVIEFFPHVVFVGLACHQLVNAFCCQFVLLFLVLGRRHLGWVTSGDLFDGPSEPELEVADQDYQTGHQPVDAIVEQIHKMSHNPKILPFLLAGIL